MYSKADNHWVQTITDSMRGMSICVVATMVALIPMLDGQCRADVQKIYWTKITSTSRSIWRADGDGTGAQQLASTTSGNPEDIALDTSNEMMYWITADINGLDRIERVHMDGAFPNTPYDIETLMIGIFGLGAGITLDTQNDKMYWCIYESFQGAGAIYRANLDATDAELVVSGLEKPDHIVLDVSNEHIYWTETGTVSKIQRANFDGTDITDLLVEDGLTGPVWSPQGLAIDFASGFMYWTQGGAVPAIKRAPLVPTDPDDVETLVSASDGLVAPRDLALDTEAGHVYWTEAWHNTIQRANFDGTAIEDVVTGAVNCVGLALVFDDDTSDTTPGDIDGSGSVDVTDLLLLLDAWGACDDVDACPADLDNSGEVDVSDLLTVLSNWSS